MIQQLHTVEINIHHSPQTHQLQGSREVKGCGLMRLRGRVCVLTISGRTLANSVFSSAFAFSVCAQRNEMTITESGHTPGEAGRGEEGRQGHTPGEGRGGKAKLCVLPSSLVPCPIP